MNDEQPPAYSGELIAGQVHAVSKMSVTVDWETKTQRMADIVSLIVSDGRDETFVKLTLPESWPASRFRAGTRWTFGIRSYVTRSNKLARVIRTDLDPYPAE